MGLISLKDTPVLSSDIIHVWVADLLKVIHHAEYFFKILSDDERKKAADYKFEKDKNRYINSRGILRELVSIYTGILPENVNFLYNINGKPYLPENKKSTLKFNLSHSGNLALYAFAIDKEIGIDLEYIRNLENLEGLAKNTLSDSELKAFKLSQERNRLDVFYKYWIHKEAYLKAAGTGISDSIKNVEFLTGKNGKLYLAENESWDFNEIITGENYKAALAVPDKNCRILLNRLEDYII